MGLLTPIKVINDTTDLLTPIQVINDTTDQWRLDYLPTNLTVINGTLINGTFINGRLYNGSDSSINGTTVIERVQPSTIGSLTVVSFIYLLMSLIIILSLTYTCAKWGSVVAGESTYKYTKFLPTTNSGTLTAREFDRQLRRFYWPKSYSPPVLPSYPETLPRRSSEDFSSQGLQEFQELMRAKYALDVKIWDFRHASNVAQPLVDEWRKHSRGATLEMMETIEKWSNSREKWSEDEWEYIKMISLRIRLLNEQERIRWPSS